MEDKDFSVLYEIMTRSRYVQICLKDLDRTVKKLSEGLSDAQLADLDNYVESISVNISNLEADIKGYSSLCLQRAAECLAKKIEESK